MTTMSPGLIEGRKRRDEAHHLLELKLQRTIRNARRRLLEIALRDGIATTDDVRTSLEIPHGLDWKFLGAVPRALSKHGLIRHAGYRESRIKENHARPIATWEIVERETALAWLAENPELVIADGDTLFPELGEAKR